MNSRLTIRYVSICVLATLTMGCFGALAEAGLGEVGIAEVGAGAAEEAAAGFAARSAAFEGATAGRGLGAFLAEETAANGGDLTFAVTRSGGLSTATRAAAGEWTSEGVIGVRLPNGAFRPVGRIIGTELWETTSTGQATVPIGSIRGATVSRGVWLRAEPSTGSTAVDLLKPEVSVSVDRIANGWFRVVVQPGNETGWLPASLVAASLFAAVHAGSRDTTRIHIVSSDPTPASDSLLAEGGDAIVKLEGGRSVTALGMEHHPGFWVFGLTDGRHLHVGDGQVRAIRPLPENVAASASDRAVRWIRLTDGRVIAGTSCRRDGGTVTVTGADSRQLTLSASLIAAGCN